MISKEHIALSDKIHLPSDSVMYKEHIALVEKIRRYFPTNEQEEAISDLSFILQTANLRGQRDAWQEIVNQRKGAPDTVGTDRR